MNRLSVVLCFAVAASADFSSVCKNPVNYNNTCDTTMVMYDDSFDMKTFDCEANLTQTSSFIYGVDTYGKCCGSGENKCAKDYSVVCATPSDYDNTPNSYGLTCDQILQIGEASSGSSYTPANCPEKPGNISQAIEMNKCCGAGVAKCQKDYSNVCAVPADYEGQVPKTVQGSTDQLKCDYLISSMEMYLDPNLDNFQCDANATKTMTLGSTIDMYQCCGAGSWKCKKDYSSVCADPTKYDGSKPVSMGMGLTPEPCDAFMRSMAMGIPGYPGVGDITAFDCTKDNALSYQLKASLQMFGCCGTSDPICMDATPPYPPECTEADRTILGPAIETVSSCMGAATDEAGKKVCQQDAEKFMDENTSISAACKATMNDGGGEENGGGEDTLGEPPECANACEEPPTTCDELKAFRAKDGCAETCADDDVKTFSDKLCSASDTTSGEPGSRGSDTEEDSGATTRTSGATTRTGAMAVIATAATIAVML